MSVYACLPSAINAALRSSNLSETSFRKIRLRTTCLYSDDSTLPRSRLAESQSDSSKPFSSLAGVFLVAAFVAEGFSETVFFLAMNRMLTCGKLLRALMLIAGSLPAPTVENQWIRIHVHRGHPTRQSRDSIPQSSRRWLLGIPPLLFGTVLTVFVGGSGSRRGTYKVANVAWARRSWIHERDARATLLDWVANEQPFVARASRPCSYFSCLIFVVRETLPRMTSDF